MKIPKEIKVLEKVCKEAIEEVPEKACLPQVELKKKDGENVKNRNPRRLLHSRP